MESWKAGRLESWRARMLEGWKAGRAERWKAAELEAWKTGGEGWRTGIGWKAKVCCKLGRIRLEGWRARLWVEAERRQRRELGGCGIQGKQKRPRANAIRPSANDLFKLFKCPSV